MRIPEVRLELLELARGMDEGDFTFGAASDRIRELERELYRRPYVRKAAARRSCPPHEDIRAYAAARPRIDYQEIAEHFGTNTGRVSEALAGFRD